MKVVFPTCCGVDVHKTFLVATIITTPADSLQPNYQKKRFSTFNSDLNRFADWLLAVSYTHLSVSMPLRRSACAVFGRLRRSTALTQETNSITPKGFVR